MIDLFYESEDSNVAGYADDTTPCSCATDIPSVALELQASATKLFRWFKDNHLKDTPGKSHILYISPRNLRLFQLMEFLLLQVPTKNYEELQ